MPSTADTGIRHAPLSSALATIFRGKLCDVVLRNRSAMTFDKDQVIYDVGDGNHSFFFLRSGFAKVGTITEDGRELIYDVRKGGDVVGELCASDLPRKDRAVALEQTEVSVASREYSLTDARIITIRDHKTRQAGRCRLE